MSDTSQIDETGFDRLLNFTIPARDARGRLVRLGPVVDTILSAHDYPPALKHLLAEALVLTALMGGLMKEEDSQVTLQAHTEGGVVELLVCDFRAGELRGYIKHDAERFAGLGANPPLEALFGKGSIAMTFDVATTQQRHQGIVPLEGSSLAEAVEYYFVQSEQVPTLIRAAVRTGPEGCVAAGLLVQHLPDGEEGRERLHVRMDHPEWEHVMILAGSARHEELVDADLSLEALLWRLFHEEAEIRTEKGAFLSRGCRCSVVRFEEVLARFPKSDREDMRNNDGIIVVDCAFCSREFAIED
ncbi:Hsp33 family molecular chaperone HslO [Altericroceibacterium xinjiangense]|uniref:Hsp33 family molecular chaperone HslO n=1 Tax=Altericroceibacterium xinjiangense TaxID=762261 RepID=UPI000F7E124E|nr:Hsp33 family molecular chaperone HslO [Altericroceibacterium xinjiangense]